MAENKEMNCDKDVLLCIDDARKYVESKLRKQEMEKRHIDEYVIDMMSFRKGGGKVSFAPFTDYAGRLIGVSAEYTYENPDWEPYSCEPKNLTVSKVYTWEQLGELITRDMVK